MEVAPQLDQKDRVIIHHLQQEGRLTNLQLAQRISLSPAATLERVRRLENRGIIRSYHAKIDPQKLDLYTCVLVLIKLNPMTAESINDFKESMSHLPAVVACYRMVGDADFLIKVIVADMAAYQQLVTHQLSKVKCVQHMKPFVVTDTIKEAGVPVKKLSSEQGENEYFA